MPDKAFSRRTQTKLSVFFART